MKTGPSHDDLMLWLDANVQTLVQHAWLPKTQWTAEELERWRQLGRPPPNYPDRAVIRGKHWEDPCGDRSMQAFIDMAVDIEIYFLFEDRDTVASGVCRRAINFEVKPRIDSLGELIRQLRRYQALGRERLVVVSPDNRYEQILIEQGFFFILAPTAQSELNL